MEHNTPPPPLVKRVGAIGDVHAHDTLLAQALAHLSTLALDLILCTGDIVDGPGSVDACVALLQQYEVESVRGNHDRWFCTPSMRDLPGATGLDDVSQETRDFLQALPRTRTYRTLTGDLLLCHGLLENDMVRLMPDDFGYALASINELEALARHTSYHHVIAGHTHRWMVRSFGHDLTIINAGHLDPQEPGFCVVDFEEATVQFFHFDDQGEPTPHEQRSFG